jgi:hypothetical protein
MGYGVEDGPQSWSGDYVEDILPLPGIEPRLFVLSARSLVAILTELSRIIVVHSF